MLVVHGFSTGGRLGLWAEDSERRVKSTSQALRAARPHPFASSAESLASLHAGKPGEAVLLLPSLRSAPLDSPELVRVAPRPPARSTPALLAWTVPVVEFDAAAALAVLTERVDGARYGASVDYLAELALFAHELAERGRVLPTLARDGDGALARWRPVLRGPDVATVHGFVAALPPVCRAVRDGDDPHALVMSGLAALVDAAVRQSLPPGLDLAPPRPAGAGARSVFRWSRRGCRPCPVRMVTSTPIPTRSSPSARCFQSDGGPPIFLLSLKAGGTGLNLTAANHVIHVDRWWNPAVEDQATDRAFRIGQKRNAQVRKFICTGTLEERIDEMIENKKALADLVVGNGEGWLTELSTGELRSVFALSEGAVGE